MRRPFILSVLIAAASTMAHSQEKPTELDFYEQTSGGTTAVCGTEFTYIFKDTLAGKQNLMGVHGSLSHMGVPGKLVAFQKFPPMDFKADLTGPPQLFQPAQVTIQDVNGDKLPF